MRKELTHKLNKTYWKSIKHVINWPKRQNFFDIYNCINRFFSQFKGTLMEI